MSPPPTHLVWLDLEMTGLDPALDDILEVYAHLASFNEPFDLEAPGISSAHYEAVLRFRDWWHVSDFIVDMHARSGLLLETMTTKCELTYKDVDRELCDAFVRDDRRLILAGSSVHFDLAFVRRRFPLFAAKLSHRVFDTSALKLAALAYGMPSEETKEEDKAHRAKADVYESVEQGRQALLWLAQR